IVPMLRVGMQFWTLCVLSCLSGAAQTCDAEQFRQTVHRSSRLQIPPYNVHICSFSDSVISIFNRYVLARVILLSYYFRK
ncbi:hypothetical protein CCL17_02560, partial [Pseudomonas congelans]